MEELLPFLQKNEFWIYVLLGAIAVIPLQQLISAWRGWQGSVYGLEREIAQHRFSAALTVLVLLVLFIFMEFVIVSFVVPGYPQIATLPTATLDLLATPTVTLPAATSAAFLSGVPTSTGEAMKEGCIPGQIEWTTPKAGDEITSNIQLTGTVNVPNLGFYKYQYAQKGEDLWTTIAGDNKSKVKGDIGFWYTDQLRNGDYLLRLVVSDNQNNLFPACVIQVRVNNPNPK